MRKHSAFRLQSGSLLPLLVISFIFLVIIGIFVLNYTQFFSSHKEAQSATDAAALQAALDLQRVVVTASDGTYFGAVGIVDDMPPGNDLNKRPVIGVNTLMATIRLDSLIADKLGNTSMLVLATQDFKRAEHDVQLLKDKIAELANGGNAKDKNGQIINLVANATAAYDANPVRSMQGAKRSGDLKITFGSVSGQQALTATPVPSPLTLAQVNNNNSTSISGVTVYRANTDIDTTVLGKQFRFRFIPLSGKVTLLDPNIFSEITPGDKTIATAIKVEADEEIGLAGSSEADSQKKKFHVVAYAQSGANPGGYQFPSGTLQVSFPFAGPPPAGQGVDFTSVKSIMNNSTVSLIDSNLTNPNPDLNGNFGTPSPYTGWNKQSKGNWFRAQGGAVPADPNASLVEDKFRGRSHDDPSVSLSFIVYDWLRSLYLRPNIDNVVIALSAPFWPSSAASTMNYRLIQPTYAEIQATHPITFGLFNVNTNGAGDPRDLTNFEDDPDGYRRQFANVFGYVAADATLPDSALVVSLDNHGNTISTNGRPVEELMDFYKAVALTNQLASNSLRQAKEAILQAIEEGSEAHNYLVKNPNGPLAKDKTERREASSRAIARGLAVGKNAIYALNLTLGIYNDRKTLSGLGVIKHSENKYEITTGEFYPISKGATVKQILAKDPIPTGQDPAANPADWTSPNLLKDDQFILISEPSKKISRKLHGVGNDLMLPALATTSVPQPNNNIFAFNINNTGEIVRSTPKLSLAGPNLLSGQYLYQNTASFVSSGTEPLVQQVWNCMARDNGATSSASYFADTQGPGNNTNPNGAGYPSLVGEWSLRCPAPTVKDFCRDTQGKVSAAVITGGFDTGLPSDFLNISIQVDGAGNTKYFYKGQEIHFYEDYNTWAKMQVDALGYVIPGGLVGANYGNWRANWINYRSYLSTSNFYNHFLNHGNPTNASNSRALAQLGPGTYSLSQEGLKMRNSAIQGIQNTNWNSANRSIMDHIWAIYNSSAFYTDNGGCAQMYVFSS